MPNTLRNYLYAGLMLGTAALLVAGVVIFHAAASFQGYIGALLILTSAAASFLAAVELKPDDVEARVRALASYLRRKRTDKETTVGN